MKHRQILDKLAAPVHVRALDEDLARWVGWQMSGARHTHSDLERAVLPPVLTRWRCLLDATDTSPVTRDKVWVALATLLHRYGLADGAVTARALAAVDELNRDVVLSDAFARHAPAIKDFLRSPPTPLARRPRQPRTMTLLRPGDVVCVQLDAHFHAAFVRDVVGAHERPVIEFYAGRFRRPPSLEQLHGRAAARERGQARFAVGGLVHLPDPANQVLALAAGHPEPPLGADPGPGEGLYTLTDSIRLQRTMATLFHAAPLEG
ncbi:hypothetical protein GA0070616_0474 [Micromonospora nigra]|uniref:Uncharacterized protein n=1 Tax=Micromonospora nigra TaxID=145857 RepID=A0A1C6RBM5_9ACTN|nr:hypothetical protein [Micromonospora nigra]SCL14556.1 hypothetical protein GA0070616_0474 [Micromonospora nigra]